MRHPALASRSSTEGWRHGAVEDVHRTPKRIGRDPRHREFTSILKRESEYRFS